MRVTVIIDSKIPPDHISYDTYSIAIFKVEIYILRFKAICRQHTVKQRLIVRRLDIAVVQAMAMGIGKGKIINRIIFIFLDTKIATRCPIIRAS